MRRLWQNGGIDSDALASAGPLGEVRKSKADSQYGLSDSVQQVNPESGQHLIGKGLDMLSSINVEQKLYVLTCGKGFSCLGFGNVFNKTVNVARWVGRKDLEPVAPIGTAEAYAEYEKAMNHGAAYAAANNEKCPCELTPQLIGLEGWRVEVEQDGEKRRFIVGKSTGWTPCHLEIAKRNSSGGPAAYGPYDKVRQIEKIR